MDLISQDMNNAWHRVRMPNRVLVVILMIIRQVMEEEIPLSQPTAMHKTERKVASVPVEV